MIIIEGPDLVGKTTLAKEIVQTLNKRGWPHVYRHLSKLPDCWHWEAVSNYSRLMSPYIVQDRFHMSEPLYSVVRGEGPMIGPGDYRAVNERLKSYMAHTIVITADDELIRERYDAHAKREMYVLEQVLEVNRLYQQAARDDQWCAYPTTHDVHIHCTDDDPWPNIGYCGLEAYQARMRREYSYPSAGAAS